MRFKNKVQNFTLALLMSITSLVAAEDTEDKKTTAAKQLSVPSSFNIMTAFDQIKSNDSNDFKVRLVSEQKKEVLKSLELDAIAKGLNQAGHMLYLAFLCVEEYKAIQAQCVITHDKFGVLCKDTGLELDRFGSSSQEVQGKLYDAVYALFSGPEADWDWAREVMAECSGIATQLSQSAKKLADRFDGLGNDTVKIQVNITSQQGVNSSKKAEIQKKMDEQQAQQAAFKETLKVLSNQRKNLEKKYKEADEEAKQASDRAFGLAIASAIVEPITAIAGTFAKTYSGGGSHDDGSTQKASQAQKTHDDAELESKKAISKYTLQKEKFDELKKTRDDLKKQKEQAEQELKDIKKLIAALSQKPQTPTVNSSEVKKEETENKEKTETTEKPAQDSLSLKEDKASPKTKDQLEDEEKAKQTEIDVITKKYEKAEQDFEAERKELTNAEDKKKLKEAALTAAAESLAKVSANLTKQSESYIKLADEMRKERRAMLNLLDKKETEEASELGKQAQLAVEMKTQVSLKDNLDLANTGLILAYGAVSKVTVTLREFSEFWQRMEGLCNQLSKDDFAKDVTRFSKSYNQKREKDSTLTIASVVPPHVQERIVKRFAGWKALEEISVTLSNEIQRTKQQVYTDFKANLHGNALYSKITELSQDHFKDLSTEISQKHKAIEDRKKERETEEQKLLTA